MPAIINADIFYTDGSVDPDSKTAAAAFVHEETTAVFRLPNGSSTLQTELVAILKALQYAEARDKPVVIHTDSLGSIQALAKGPPKDNVSLVTTIWATAQQIKENGRTIHLNWIPSHVGIPGNEEADTAAKNALHLPTVTAHPPPSLSNLKNLMKSASHEVAKRNLRRWASEGSPSANWYLIARNNRTPFPSQLNRKTRNHLHRLRLGYRCHSEIKNTEEECAYCSELCTYPLLHWIQECPETRPYIRRELGTAPQIIEKTPHATLAELVRAYPPPR